MITLDGVDAVATLHMHLDFKRMAHTHTAFMSPLDHHSNNSSHSYLESRGNWMVFLDATGIECREQMHGVSAVFNADYRYLSYCTISLVTAKAIW